MYDWQNLISRFNLQICLCWFICNRSHKSIKQNKKNFFIFIAFIWLETFISVCYLKLVALSARFNKLQFYFTLKQTSHMSLTQNVFFLFVTCYMSDDNILCLYIQECIVIADYFSGRIWFKTRLLYKYIFLVS